MVVKARGAKLPNGRCGSWVHGRPSNRPIRHPEVASRPLGRPAGSIPSAGTGHSDCEGGEKFAPAPTPTGIQVLIVVQMVGLQGEKEQRQRRRQRRQGASSQPPPPRPCPRTFICCQMMIKAMTDRGERSITTPWHKEKNGRPRQRGGRQAGRQESGTPNRRP